MGTKIAIHSNGAVTYKGGGEAIPVSTVHYRKVDTIVIKVPSYKAWVGREGGYAKYDVVPTTLDVISIDKEYEDEGRIIIEGNIVISFPVRKQ